MGYLNSQSGIAKGITILNKPGLEVSYNVPRYLLWLSPLLISKIRAQFHAAHTQQVLRTQPPPSLVMQVSCPLQTQTSQALRRLLSPIILGLHEV
jgi:hypothetical protein